MRRRCPRVQHQEGEHAISGRLGRRPYERPGAVMDLTVRVRPSDQGTVVQVGGDLDIESNSSFQEILRYVLRSYSPRLLLDLANVPFMDCAGLGSLVLTRRRAEMRKGSVR